MGPTAMEEFYYGALRSMKQEYLIRTITKALEEDSTNVKQVWVKIDNQYETPLGDDKVEIGMYVEEVIAPEPMFEGNVTSRCMILEGGVASLQKEPETVWTQLSRDTYLSDICYEVARILSKGC